MNDQISICSIFKALYLKLLSLNFIHCVKKIQEKSNDDWKIIFVILHQNLGCGCSLESPCHCNSNEHPQHTGSPLTSSNILSAQLLF